MITTPTSRYYAALDGLRCIAFLLVFIHHQPAFASLPGMNVLHRTGWIGVDLFFTLSAFLITKLLAEEYRLTKTINFRKFCIRRILRIWPLFFLYTLFSLLAYGYFNDTLSRYVIMRALGLITFSDNLLAACWGYNPLPYIAHFWTISYEEQFYLIIPLVVWSMYKLPAFEKKLVVAGIFIFLYLIKIIYLLTQVPHPALWVLPVTHFESIILGVMLALLKPNIDSMKTSAYSLPVLASLTFLAVVYIPRTDNYSYSIVLSYLLAGICTTSVLLLALTEARVKKVLSSNIMVYLGKRSYGLYVFHVACIAFTDVLVRKLPAIPNNAFVHISISLTLTILAAAVSYNLVELPFLKKKKRYTVIASTPSLVQPSPLAARQRRIK